jgi:hypothetical protein
MEENAEVRLSPPWKHALATLLNRGMPYGMVITKSELVQLFGLRDPVTADDERKFQLDYLAQFSELRDELLEEHRLYLRTVWGDGAYEVTPPSQQTERAFAEGTRELRRVIRKMARGIAFVRHEELTDQERADNADKQAKAAAIAGMMRKQIKGP